MNMWDTRATTGIDKILTLLTELNHRNLENCATAFPPFDDRNPHPVLLHNFHNNPKHPQTVISCGETQRDPNQPKCAIRQTQPMADAGTPPTPPHHPKDAWETRISPFKSTTGTVLGCPGPKMMCHILESSGSERFWNQPP